MRCGACGRLAVVMVPCAGGEGPAKVCLLCFRRLYSTSAALAAGLLGGVV